MEDLRKAGEISSRTVVLNEPEVLFDVWCGQLQMARVCGGNKAAPAFALHRGTTVSQREDDAGAPLSMWPLALHYIAALCQYCRVSPSHCFLYRLILHNPGNPTVARVKYQAPAVSPLTFFSDVIFLSSFLHTGLQL